MQKEAIQGRVIDKETREELAGVKIESGKEKVYTNFEGEYKLKNYQDSIKITQITYQTILIKSEEAKGKIIELERIE